MREQLMVATALTLLAGAAFAAQPDEQLEQLETVLVTGEQPGPGLWKVSKDDHVLWVLASYGPLPKNMTWRAKQVEARIAESQEVLLGGNVGIRPNIGILRGITLIPAALKAGKNPTARHSSRCCRRTPTQGGWRCARSTSARTMTSRNGAR
jgi:hypothetical protein